jgi:hypothetical protein
MINSKSRPNMNTYHANGEPHECPGQEGQRSPQQRGAVDRAAQTPRHSDALPDAVAHQEAATERTRAARFPARRVV